MKRMVTNYPEFEDAINTLFSQTSIYNIREFEVEASASKQRRKEKIAVISARIRAIKAEIENCKTKIRQATATDNKKEIGIRLNRLITAKTTLLKTYREEKNLTPFASLSTEAKVYACTQSLLKKYLLPAFVKFSPEAFKVNDDGSVTLNVELFQNSILYQQANHIKDYVSSYIEHYPHRVNGSRYFNGLHKNLPTFEDVIDIADEYFELINQQNEKSAEALKQSREGIEVVEIYPEYKVQAVRLKNAAALKYEGTEMAHCVASYASKVEKGESEIYSIRDYGDEYAEFIPHATIEVKDGKVKQIKGYKDNLVDLSYIKATRRLLVSLLNLTDENELFNCRDIPQSEKNNIGYLKDTQGILRDIFIALPAGSNIVFEKLTLKASRLKYLDFNQIKIKELDVIGAITPKTIRHIAKSQNLSQLNLIFQNEQTENILDLSAISCDSIKITFKKNTLAKKLLLPKNLQKLTISGNMTNLLSIEGMNCLQELQLDGEFHPDVLIMESLQKLKKLKLKGSINLPTKIAFPLLEVIDLDEGTFGNVKKIDFSECPNISIVNLGSNSTFPNLKEIIISASVKRFTSVNSVFPLLERMDFSQSPRKTFGTLDVDGHQTLDFASIYEHSLPILGGYIINYSKMPMLKELILRDDIERINLSGLCLRTVSSIDFNKYKELKELSLQRVYFQEDIPFDLSQCAKLQILHVDSKRLPNIIPAANIKELHICKEKETPPPQSLNLKKYKHLQTLYCDFIPPKQDIPPSVKKLDLFLMNDANAELKEFDVANVHRLSTKTSMQFKLPKLERLALPESFTNFFLHNLSPCLTEIDLHQTKGTVKIIINDYSDEIINEKDNIIYLHKDQMNVIKKIRLGKDTDLELPESAKELPIEIELPQEMTDNEKKLKNKCPHITFISQNLNRQIGIIFENVQR